MTELERNAVLRFLLETTKSLAIEAHRQQGWITALWQTIERDDELRSALEKHPLYYQVPHPAQQRIDVLTQNIDVLLRELG